MIATLPVASLTAGLPAWVLLAGGLALGWVRTFWEEGRAGVLPK